MTLWSLHCFKGLLGEAPMMRPDKTHRDEAVLVEALHDDEALLDEALHGEAPLGEAHRDEALVSEALHDDHMRPRMTRPCVAWSCSVKLSMKMSPCSSKLSTMMRPSLARPGMARPHSAKLA